MGLEGLLNLEGKDLAVFMLACALGWLASSFMPPGAWAVYTSILVAYHLFLGWLVITAEGETGVSLPVTSTILTHVACVAIIFPLGMARHFVPFFGIVRYSIAGLAIFERGWLFSGKIRKSNVEQAQVATPAVTGTAKDYEEWLKYLAQRKQIVRAPGSLKAEYEQWLIARRRSEQSAPSSDG